MSPTATQVDSDLEEASKRKRGAASDNWISECDLLRRNGFETPCAEDSMPKMSLVLKLLVNPMALARISKDLR